MDTLLLARIADLLAVNVWMKTKDAKKKKNRPQSILQVLTGEDKKNKPKKFKSSAAFDAAFKSLTGGG